MSFPDKPKDTKMKKLLMTTAMTLALIAPAAHVLAQTTTDTDPLKKLLTSGSASSETGVTGDSIGDDGVGHDNGIEALKAPAMTAATRARATMRVAKVPVTMRAVKPAATTTDRPS